MENLKLILQSWLTGRVAFVGLGDPTLGDDAVGLHLARRLARRISPPHRVWLMDAAPDRCLRELREERFDRVVLLDAADFGAAPGAAAWFEASGLEGRFPTVSTHRLPLALLARLIMDGSRTDVALLGIQPGSLQRSCPLSPPVQATANALATLLAESLADRGVLHPAGAAHR